MSGSTRAITLTLSVRDADSVKRTLEGIGPAGEQALARLEAAAQKAAGRSGGGGGGMRGLGQTLGQAGFQIQDFAVQVQSGTNALTALSQQGSQLLGVFGTGGAIAGAVLTVGLLAANLFTTAGAATTLNDALSSSKSLYSDLNDAAEQRARGLDEEARRQLALTRYLAGTTAEARAGIEAFQRLDRLRLANTAATELEGAVGGLRSRLRTQALGDAGGWMGTDIVPNLVPLAGGELPAVMQRVRDAIEAVGAGGAITRTQIDELAGALDAAARSGGAFGRQATEALASLEQKRASLYQVADAFQAMGVGVDAAAQAMARLRAEAAANIGQDLTARLFAAQQIASRYARGDVAGARGITRDQEIDARAQALAEQARDAARRSFPEGTPQTEINAALAARRDQIDSDARALANTERANREAEERARKAEQDALRNARSGARDAQREQREAERDAQAAMDAANRADTQDLRDYAAALQAIETPMERYTRRVEELSALQVRLQEAGTPMDPADDARLFGAIEKELRDAEARTNGANSAARELGMTFSSAFEDAIVKGEDLRKVLDGIAQDLARIILRQAVVQPLAGAAADAAKGIGNWLGGMFSGPSTPTVGAVSTSSALGNAFANGRLIPFASGGMVDRATVVPMALMGEAGPEAIMPLRRGKDGKLGVAAQGSGGGGVVNNFTIDARGADPSVVPLIRAGIEEAVRRSQAEFLASIQRGGQAAKIVGRRS